MLNQVVCVARLVDEPIYEKLSENESKGYILLSVQRPYKNKKGEYDNDVIPCILNNALSDNVKEYCHAKDIVGVKGHLVSKEYLDDKNEKKYNIAIMCEKITFLSSKKGDEN